MLIINEIQRIQKLMVETEKDCLKLKRQGHLTEYGEGQLDLIQILKSELKNKS